MDDGRLCIIGTGLIGCSFALGLKAAGYKGHITGFSRNQSTLDTAMETGAIDSGHLDLGEAVSGTRLVMLTVPMQATRQLLEDIHSVLDSTTIVTDGGSVKGSFIKEAREILSDDQLQRLVPGHPIAGRELSGAAAAQADLFQNKRVLITALPESRQTAVAEVSRLWSMTGANVEEIEPEVHDRVLAATSHLPHVVAYGLVDLLATKNEREEIFRYAAGGFRDFTRIASSDPTMWRDICATNATEIDQVLGDLIENLLRLKNMIGQGDTDALFDAFVRAKAARDEHTG